MTYEKRKLAAIMFTDMSGYSTLMHRNEVLGLELLQEHRAVIRPLIGKFHGREIDTAGDGFVIEFASTQDAVCCALEIQESFASRNLSVPAAHKIELRIGIHTGDVMHASSDEKLGIYGDGVNIAARLEPLAPVGGICVSGTVYAQINGKLDCSIHFMGKTKLKGIANPIRTYSIELRKPALHQIIRRRLRRQKAALGFSVAMPVAFAVAAWIAFHPVIKTAPTPSSKALRIAVMPFDLPSMNAEDAFLSDGITGGIISALSQKGIHVIAKNSVVELKKLQKTSTEIGRDLKVDRLVTGTLQKNRDEIRVNVSFIDPSTQEVLWSKDFTAKDDDAIGIQTAISDSISNQFKGRMTASIDPESKAVTAMPKKDAYTAYLKGQFFLGKRSKDALRKSTEHFAEAVKLDPGFSEAYAALSISERLQSWYGTRPPAEAESNSARHAMQALGIDPNCTEAILSLAEQKAYVEFDFAEAEKLYRRAIDTNTQNATAHQWYGEFLAYQGRAAESYAEIDKALEIDPVSLVANVAKGVVRFLAHDYDAAIAILTSARDLDHDYMLSNYWLGRSYIAMKNYGVGIPLLEKALEQSAGEPMLKAVLSNAYAVSGQKQKANALLNELKVAAKSRYVSPYHFAIAQAGLGNQTLTHELLKQSIAERGSQTVAIFVDPSFNDLRATSEFKAIIASLKSGGN